MSTNRKKVSVIITCFNQEAFIEESVTSIINQTYADWECIVVNDGSSDGSEQIIKKLSSQDRRILYVSQHNQGVSNARNTGYARISGEYIQFLDGDDYLTSEKLETQVDFMEDNPDIGVSYTNHKQYLQEKNISVQYYFKPLNGKVLPELLYEYDNGVSIPIHTALLRRSVWDAGELPFPTDYDGRYEDWVFWVNIALKATNFRFLNYDMAFYRIHNSNFCNTPKLVLENSIKAMNYISDMSPKIQKDLFLKEKQTFFEQRFANDVKAKRNNNTSISFGKKLRNKVGSIRRNLESRFIDFKELKYRAKLQADVKNKNFTIISNNCWGGGIYEDLNLPYLTPTVGLYFFSSCYLKFISKLETYLSLPLTFINSSKYEKANLLRVSSPYPIGLLNNEVEIHFLHYHTKRDALEKWNRRKERINLQNIYLSHTDNEGYTEGELLGYDKLPFKKVFFSSKPLPGISSAVHLKTFDGKKTIGDIYSNRWSYRHDFNVASWLNQLD